ncbi:MAG: radical SAM protein [Desulfovibrio sp.]|jgi:uncharacterized protein|nr:radical SAM protein [Desulfovibrio sp.]
MKANAVDKGTGSMFQAGVFVLPVNGAFLIYSPLGGIASLLNASALRALRRRMGKAVPDPSFPSELRELADLLIRKPCEPPSETERLNPLFLGILPTRRCNCNCVYCDFDAGEEKASDMSPAMAEAALTWYAHFLKDAGQDHMEVHFFGGEPLVCRDVVETAVHRSRLLAGLHGLSLHLEVSTNGIFEQEYAQFVGDYFHAVVLSLDGFRDVHDRHRPISSRRGSFSPARQTATLLSLAPTELCLRCCVSNLNIQSLEEIAIWFCEEFQPSVINFEPLTNNPKSRAAGLSPPDPYAFVRQYAKARARTLHYGIKTVYAATEGEPSQTSFCPVGKDVLIVSPDGRISSCYLPRKAWVERGLDMDVGRLSVQDGMHVDQDALLRLRGLVRAKPRCERCFCQWVCSGGCHVQHSYPGSSPAYGPFCIQTRLLSACRLLEDMNLSSIAQALLADEKAMEALALQPSDRFEPAG